VRGVGYANTAGSNRFKFREEFINNDRHISIKSRSVSELEQQPSILA
jgi:hypothetical protein